jgi:hypothetical protein
MTCPHCGNDLLPGDTRCRQCGRRVAPQPGGQQQRGRARTRTGLFILLVIVFLLGLAVGRFTAPVPPPHIIAVQKVVTATPLPATATPLPTTTPVPTKTPLPTSTPTAVPTPQPTATKTAPPPTPKPKPPAKTGPLYQTTWARGTDGWSLPQGWNTLPGELVNDGTTYDEGQVSGLAHPPPISPATPNYAVVADIQMVRQNSLQCAAPGFGLGVRGDATGNYYLVGLTQDNGSWYSVIVDTSFKSGACSFNRLTASALDKKNVAPPDTNWHTYRVEVRGNRITLKVDGNTVAETTDNHHLQGNTVGVWSAEVVLNVRKFRVMAL